MNKLHPPGLTPPDCSAVIEPEDGLPPLAGAAAMRWTIERQLEALLTEIERRAAQPAARG
jgi:hypothetical protein